MLQIFQFPFLNDSIFVSYCFLPQKITISWRWVKLKLSFIAIIFSLLFVFINLLNICLSFKFTLYLMVSIFCNIQSAFYCFWHGSIFIFMFLLLQTVFLMHFTLSLQWPYLIYSMVFYFNTNNVLLIPIENIKQMLLINLLHKEGFSSTILEDISSALFPFSFFTHP